MKQHLKIIDNILLLLLTGFVVVQLYETFKSREASFTNPLHYFKENYGNDFVSQYGHRFTEIKKMFPELTQITYVSEPNEDLSSGWTNYFLTQYYMAPNLLEKKVVHDTVLYNLYASRQINPATNYHLNNGWHLVKDFNNGLILLAK